jgi:hypothetical protein
MPGNTKPRKRKHRGTQTGSLDRRGRTGRPRNRQEAMARQKRRQGDRRTRPPTWRSAAIRGIFFAVLLFPVSILFGQPAGGAAALSVFAAFVYVPLVYFADGFVYRRRVAKLERQKLAAKGDSRQDREG